MTARINRFGLGFEQCEDRITPSRTLGMVEKPMAEFAQSATIKVEPPIRTEAGSEIKVDPALVKSDPAAERNPARVTETTIKSSETTIKIDPAATVDPKLGGYEGYEMQGVKVG